MSNKQIWYESLVATLDVCKVPYKTDGTTVVTVGGGSFTFTETEADGLCYGDPQAATLLSRYIQAAVA